LFQDFLVKYDYEPDWALNPNPRIAAEHSTLHVQRMPEEGLAAHRKAQSGLPQGLKLGDSLDHS